MSSEEFWHRMTEWLRWEGTSGDCLVQAPALIKITDDTKLGEVVDTADGCQQDQVAQDVAWFWISSWMKTAQPFRENVWTSSLLKKKCAFLCLNGTFCTSVCAHCPSSCHWASLWKFIPVGYLHTKISQRLPISGLNSPSCLSLSSYVRCSKPLIILVAFCWTLCSVPTCTGEPRSGPSSPVTSHQGKLEGKGHLTWCADIALPNAFQHTAGFLCCRSTLPTDANLVPSKTPGAFFARLFYNSLAPAWPGAWAGPNISLSWTSGGSCHSFL